MRTQLRSCWWWIIGLRVQSDLLDDDGKVIVSMRVRYTADGSPVLALC